MKRLCIHLLSLCVLVALTTACGWHLRGAIALPSNVEQLHLSAEDSFSPLMTELRERLADSGVELVPSASAAPYSLDITEQEQESRVAGVGGDALANAYELTLEARYDIRRSTGEPIAEDLSSSVIRSYNSSAASAGSGAQEELLVLREMRRELAQQILRRLLAEINSAETQPPVAD